MTLIGCFDENARILLIQGGCFALYHCVMIQNNTLTMAGILPVFGGVLRHDLMQAQHSIRIEHSPEVSLKEVYLMFWIELLIVLVMIFIGTRKGGLMALLAVSACLS